MRVRIGERAEPRQLGRGAVAAEREVDDAIGDPDRAREPAAGLVDVLDEAVAEQAAVGGEVIGESVAYGRCAIDELIEQIEGAGAIAACQLANLGGHRERDEDVEAELLFVESLNAARRRSRGSGAPWARATWSEPSTCSIRSTSSRSSSPRRAASVTPRRARAQRPSAMMSSR